MGTLKRRNERRELREVAEQRQVVVFRVGGEFYGLDITTVREIDRMQPVTKVPRALPFVEGVIHLREMIIPVIDLAKRFGLPPVEPDRQTRIIIAAVTGQPVGLIVHQVTEVVPLSAKSVEPAPALTFSRDQRHVGGMARVGERLVSILNLDRLFSTEEVTLLHQQQSLF